jgi:hypothetical protein
VNTFLDNAITRGKMGAAELFFASDSFKTVSGLNPPPPHPGNSSKEIPPIGYQSESDLLMGSHKKCTTNITKFIKGEVY